MSHARVLLLFAAFLAPAAARADGAFPDELQILLPADRPRELMLATNFGLAVSEDDGANWYLACEQAIASYAALYAIGAAPDDAVYAAAPAGLSISRDRGCTWAMAGGALAGNYVADEFPDPTDPARVLALGRLPTAGGGFVAALFASGDGGRTFGAPLYQARPGDVLNGVELARAAPSTIYLTAYAGQAPIGPSLLRSLDGGASFVAVDQSAVSANPIFLAAVDPVDPLRVYLRIRQDAVDDLGVSDDGGDHVRVALHLDQQLTAFLRRADGTILAGTRYGDSYRSIDGAQSFQRWPNAPHLRALAERDGILYAAGDNLLDHFAIARSTDEGATWEPLMRFEDLRGPLDCPNIQTICQVPWQQLMSAYGIGVEPLPDGGGAPPPDLPVASGGCQLDAPAQTGAWAAAACALLFLLARKKRA